MKIYPVSTTLFSKIISFVLRTDDELIIGSSVVSIGVDTPPSSGYCTATSENFIAFQPVTFKCFDWSC